ncbi:MAG: hypothetical protein GY727_07085 [Gammaproteobacteria bacterium]|nr:hypothetical protein [Gammaproteobacteria bacterium]MCP4091635.1 hypothetical protein [Gammaproteobacteria bacterium]MCP4276131.1 hypothetical protein [Gammaproteobacteria bacterium]MCP4830875.1 hypothetical protein [Gammaproteobacteria bacterium]MCP4929701.1 hypothetical protein [Gammaproteobacteria bacterium]
MNVQILSVLAGCLLLVACGGPADSVDHEDEGDMGFTETEETASDPMLEAKDQAAVVEEIGIEP